MALLDVLSVVFDADASKLKKGAGEAEETIESTKKTVIDTDKAAESLGDSFLDTIGSAKAAITGLLGLGAITAAVVSQAAATDQLGKFSQTIGVNIEEVGAWGEAVARSGGSMEGFQGSLSSLTDNLTDLALTGSGPAAEAFARLGIDAVDSGGKMKSAFDLLPEIAESFEGLSAAESVALGQKLGLDQSTILLLQQGRQSVDDLVERQKRLGVATQEDADIAAKFNDAWDDTKQVFNALAREAGSTFLPIFTDILGGVESVVQFLRDNRELVTGFFIGAAAAVTYFYLPAMLAAAATTLATIAPFIAIGAAIAAVGLIIGLLYDDIQAFLSGGDSLIGLLVDGVVGAFNAVGDAVNEAWQTVKDFFSFITGAYINGITSVFNKVKGFLGFGGDDDPINDAEANASKSKQAIEAAANNPLSGQSAQSIATTSNSINRNTAVSVENVNVDARGGDAQEISGKIGTALKDEMSAAVSNNDDGIMI